MKKILLTLLVFIITMVVIITIDTYPRQHRGTGIYFDTSQQTISFIPVDSYSKPLCIRTNPEYRFISHTIIEDSTLPLSEERFVHEFSILGNLLYEDSKQEINLKITARYFLNGDMFVIYRLFSTEDLPSPIQLEISFPPSLADKTNIWSFQYGTNMKPTEMMATEADMIAYTRKSGIHVLPASLQYMEFSDAENKPLQSCLLGPMGVYKEKEINLVELVNTKFQPVLNNVSNQSASILFSFDLKAYQRAESWFFYSTKQLLDYQNENTKTNMLSADLNIRKRLSFDGIYHIATSQFYQGATDITYDYYYNYAMWEGRRFMELYKSQPEETFYYDMFMNALFTTIKGVNRYGYWKSNVRSLYLWNQYRVKEGYIDTRYCTDAGFFLLNAYNEFHIQAAIKAGEEFGQFLIDKSKAAQGISIQGQGFFFYDYYYPDQELKTHASLNHILSELNYLFELYLSTQNDEFLHLAEQILEGIHLTEKQWIRTDNNYRFKGDLWYAVFPESNGLTFKDHDYTKTLTYSDLLKAKKNIKTIYNKEDDVINRLIESKKGFLLREGHTLPES
ncbi:hypothetical protein LLG10_08095 [bacterium]|nr:hypothetical protein [bacterium]